MCIKGLIHLAKYASHETFPSDILKHLLQISGENVLWNLFPLWKDAYFEGDANCYNYILSLLHCYLTSLYIVRESWWNVPPLRLVVGVFWHILPQHLPICKRLTLYRIGFLLNEKFLIWSFHYQGFHVIFM